MKKERKLDRLYIEFDKEYSGKSQEEMEKIISNLEKEIAGKENSLESLEDEKRENLQKNIEQGKKRLENLKGYSKNKTQIEGIKKYKVSMEKKLKQEIAIKDESSELLKKVSKELHEVSKKLSDEKYTMTLEQDEYNALLEEKAKCENEKKLQEERYLKSNKRITELQSKIGKCDLAWKTLFVNKSWDDIQRIALEPNTRFTRKVDSEKHLPLKNNKNQNLIHQQEEEIKQEIAEDVKRIEEDRMETTTALVEKKEGFFKRMWHKFKKWIRGEEIKEVVSETQPDVSKESTTKQERDVFLEGLRQHVDVEYRKAVKEEKDAQYKEAHKVQPKKEEKQAEEEETR